MAIMPYCRACGFDAGAQAIYEVTFRSDVLQDTSWFCDAHAKRARRLRHLTSTRAIEMMRADADRGFSGLLLRLRLSTGRAR